MMLRWLERQTTTAGLLRLSLLFNIPFVVLRLHRNAYDTYSHHFFADHYRHNWWSLWEPRWYLGFSTASYPPLIHQLIALLSWPIEFVIAAFAPAPEAYPGAFRLLGEEAVYVMVQLAVLALFPLAVRAFARVFAPERSASWAALLAIALPALNLAAWSFGQLPTLAATTVMLFALANGAHYLRTGERRALVQAVSLAALAAATHHAVFLFVPFAALGITWHLARDTAARLLGLRAVAWASLSALVVAAMLWPFLQWSADQNLQAPIDHASRYNFFARPEATLFFFWPVYGPLILVTPLLLRRRWWGLAATVLPLMALSLGGTTLLPRVLFGAGWEWLTYDRFGLWAAMGLLLPTGATLTRLSQHRTRATLTVIGVMAVAGVASGCLALLAHTQPAPVSLTPIVQFLNTQSQYRYLTLGFGDQFAKLSAAAQNGTVDGNYHTARGLPELRHSGLGALDGAVWNPNGVWAVAPILREAQRYGLRWVLVNHSAYQFVLRATGWRYRFDVGTVQAWERDDVAPVAIQPPAESRAAALWWGAMPLAVLAFVVAMVAAPLVNAGSRLQLRPLRRALLALTIVLLALWWVAVPYTGADDLPHIYFTYRSVLIFASDVALALALAVWLVERAARRIPLRFASLLLAPLVPLVSAIASADRALTFAFVLHLMLLMGLFVMLRDDPPQAAWIGALFGVMLAVQCGLALAQAVTQNTYMLHDLFLRWPGDLEAAVRGASVSANADGERWLRVYGSLPHPNVLGAFLLAFSGAAWERWFATGRRVWMLLLAMTATTLVLTFSRAAWLGVLAMLVGLWWLAPIAQRSRLRIAAALGTLSVLLAALPLWPYLAPRADVSGSVNELERASTLERTLLIGYSLDAFRAQPLTGVGAAGFVQWAARNIPERYPFEPVHSVPLLILAETGLLGAVIVMAGAGAWLWWVWRQRKVMSIGEAAWSATLLGLTVTALFDHLWWSQAPARTLLVLIFAQWASARQAAKTPGN